jgi:uncharacterized protein
MIAGLEKEKGAFSIFGGEPLLMKFEDLARLLKYGFDKWQKTSIQTNGTLINDDHINLFKKYNTSVGISVDGPGDLNSVRHANSGDSTLTEHLTANSQRSIERLLRESIPLGLIITLHTGNCGIHVFPEFVKWIGQLDKLGVTSARLHFLEGDHAPELKLTSERLTEVMLFLAKLEMRELKNLRFDKFGEMLSLLANEKERGSCVWNNCDPYTTEAVRGVNGDGTSSNCGRVNKDGVNWLKANSTSHVRQLILYNTSQDHGGCKDCRFFLPCRGYCPGTAIDSDWRNRTEHCSTIKALFTHYEGVLLDNRKTPISMVSDRQKIEQNLLTQLRGSSQQTHVNTMHEDWTLIGGRKVHKAEVR